jgi:hypothetical protein
MFNYSQFARLINANLWATKEICRHSIWLNKTLFQFVAGAKAPLSHCHWATGSHNDRKWKSLISPRRNLTYSLIFQSHSFYVYNLWDMSKQQQCYTHKNKGIWNKFLGHSPYLPCLHLGTHTQANMCMYITHANIYILKSTVH